MPLGSATRTPASAVSLIIALAVASWIALTWITPSGPAAAASAAHTEGVVPLGQHRPDLARGVAYLTSPANLIGGHYYESFPRTADFGLTIDGAFALAATGTDIKFLKEIVGFIAHGGKDPSGRTVNAWTGIGTRSASGGAIGKEALLAEVVGANPRSFGGHDLIAALDASICRGASAGTGGPCAGRGNYRNATSVFDQALGIIAQVRAGQRASAAAPVAFLERLRNADGSFPSLIPDSHDHDIDSTAMAVMALALVRASRARADVDSGLAWIASQQQSAGGFRGVGGISVNSAGLAIQALTLRAARYRAQIRLALAFLASEQNSDGGFNAYAGGQPGSNVRASTQAVSGATGISFGTLTRPLGAPGARKNAAARSATWPWLAAGAIVIAAALITGLALRRRRPGSPRPPAPARPAGQPQDRITP
jgi:hypothetical protein